MQESATVSVSTPVQSAPSEGERVQGTLLRVVEEKGFGFIRPDSGPPDFFVNVSSFRDRTDFRRGRRVEFTPGTARHAKDGERPKAAPALDVAGLDAAPAEGDAQ